jgi:uncharacterized membrane protein
MQTEELIERAVERKIDSLDRRYMKGEITNEEYETLTKEIYNWCDEEYKKLSN